MAITITEGNLDTSTNSNSCNLSESRDVLVRDSASNTQEVIPFHRHCQKTVCSAWQGGSGLTRKILLKRNNDDTAFLQGDLSNIQSFISGTPNTWQGYFTKNSDNITEDLRSILELINIISGKLATKTSWKLVFKDCGNKEIGNNTINPWSNGSQEYNFTNIGRYLTLNVDGHPLKFHTIRSGINSAYVENLSIDLPKNDLTIKFNDYTIGTVHDIYMNSSEEVNINYDYNFIPATISDPPGYLSPYVTLSGDTYTIHLSPCYHIYRIKATSDFKLKFDTTNYGPSYAYHGYESRGHRILDFEVHVKNSSGNDITALNLDDVGNENSNTRHNRWFTDTDSIGIIKQFNYLNDETIVKAGKTCVYVFRIDSYMSSMTWSLAYIAEM